MKIQGKKTRNKHNEVITKQSGKKEIMNNYFVRKTKDDS